MPEKESDTLKQYFDEVAVNLTRTFDLIDQQEEKITELKEENKNLKDLVMKIVKYMPSEPMRRKARKEAGIIQ